MTPYERRYLLKRKRARLGLPFGPGWRTYSPGGSFAHANPSFSTFSLYSGGLDGITSYLPAGSALSIFSLYSGSLQGT